MSERKRLRRELEGVAVSLRRAEALLREVCSDTAEVALAEHQIGETLRKLEEAMRPTPPPERPPAKPL